MPKDGQSFLNQGFVIEISWTADHPKVTGKNTEERGRSREPQVLKKKRKKELAQKRQIHLIYVS